MKKIGTAKKISSAVLISMTITITGGFNFSTISPSDTKDDASYSLMGPKAAVAANQGIQYIVQPGDSLWKIALEYSTTVEKIMAQNNLTSDRLSLDQVLWIYQDTEENAETNPVEQNTTTENAADPQSNEADSKYSYVVQQGDTLWVIAKKYSMNVDTLKALNGLTSDDLSIGQVLYFDNRNLNKTPSREKTTTTAKTTTEKKTTTTKNTATDTKKATTTTSQKTSKQTASKQETPAPKVNSVNRSTADKVLATAKTYMGVPYVYGGRSIKGFDCSGFTSYVFSQYGINLPRTSKAQASAGVATTRADAQPGDLVLFNTRGSGVSHVGIYMGDGKFIHASTSNGISITSLDSSYYKNRLVAVRRVL